jgi:uncharacterized lipoprotein YmbA
MIDRLAVLAMLCALAALTAGCASTPPSHFYTLSATAPPATATSSLVVVVGPVSVPDVIDRPQIVVSTGANELQLDEFNRWASPLQDNLSRVVAENLVSILGTPRVTLFPQAPGAAAEYRVAIEVYRFDSAPGKSTALDAVWTVRRVRDGKAESGRISARETVLGNSYDALAAAHSRAVARLSQDIADAVRALDRAARPAPHDIDEIEMK